MWLNQLFVENSINFDKRCKTRMILGIIISLLGLLAFAMVFFLDTKSQDHIVTYYAGAGFGLFFSGAALAVQNFRYLKTPALKRKREVAETDERNRMIGLRCWAYAGYSMFLLLYIGILISGFISALVMQVLVVIGCIYAILLAFFRRLLQKAM